MIIDIPVGYKAHVIPPKRRKGGTVDLTAIATVELREASAAEAPVVAWWAEHEPAMQSSIRWFDGALYAPVACASASAAEELGLYAADGSAAHRPYPAGQGWACGARTPPALSSGGLAAALASGRISVDYGEAHPRIPPQGPDTVPGQVVSSGLDGARAMAAESAAALLAVDGIVFRRVEAPLICIERTHRGTEMLPRRRGDFLRERVLAFTLAEHPAALAAWRKARAAAGEGIRERDDPRSDPGRSGRMPPPDILRPDLLPALDSRASALRDVAASMLASLESDQTDISSGHPRGTPRAARYDRPVMRAYAGLRDGLAAAEEGDDLAARVRAVCEACAPHGTLRYVHAEGTRLLERLAEERADEDVLADLEGFGDLDEPTRPGGPA